jgi:demethylmenaquinone methyltransferase/2-methoxy-6-polyprenyl-1,4-benzoquinol methylase
MTHASSTQSTSTSDEGTTHFGYRRVDAGAKTGRVREVFSSVAGRYDLMNDLMSGGMHRLWKHRFTRDIHLGAHAAILDLAGGTGDIAVRLKAQTGAHITICDINEAMLRVGRDRQFDAGEAQGLRWACGNAESLPVADHSLDLITIAFGLRNVTDIPKALHEAARALKPGGQFRCLEFSQVVIPLLAKLYDRYSFEVIPRIGAWVTKDRDSYQYLVESIRMFPKQEALKQMMEDAGLAQVRYENLTAGVVAIHRGWKI